MSKPARAQLAPYFSPTTREAARGDGAAWRYAGTARSRPPIGSGLRRISIRSARNFHGGIFDRHGIEALGSLSPLFRAGRGGLPSEDGDASKIQS